MQGRLIVIEGSDGAGKGTQLELLTEYCQKKTIPHEKFDFPQYGKTFFGDLCGRYLNGDFGAAETVSPYLVSLSYAADRWQAKPMIEQALSEGKIVFANRYAPSNAAYHGSKLEGGERSKFIDWEFELEYEQFKIPREDIVFYLHIPVLLSQKLIEQKAERSYLTDGKKKDIHEDNLNLLQTTESIYLDFCSKLSHWVCIECCEGDTLLSKEAIHEKILEELRKRGML